MAYTSEYFAEREGWRDWRIEARELIRLAQMKPGATILEIGCGGGGLLRILHDQGARVVGADTQDTALRMAQSCLRKNSPLKPDVDKRAWGIESPALVRISADNQLPFASASFDAILGQHVVEHIDDTFAALREWHRLLRPNGRLVLATPNANYPDPAHFSDASHTHILTPSELRDALATTGFIMEECFTAFPYLGRNRVLRGVGVVGYNVFRQIPHFSGRGRTIMIAARKSQN